MKLKGAKYADRDIPEEIFQEIFLRFREDNFKKLRSFRAKNGCSLASWIRQVTVNFTIDYLRKKKTLVSLDEEGEDGRSLKDKLPADSEPVPDKLISAERAGPLVDCIEMLDIDDKYFLEMHFNRGLSLEALKDIFKLACGAVDMRKKRLLERLRGCFKSKGFELDL